MIIGIGHVARVGKDTAAEALMRDLQFTRLSFADKLRELAFHADPLVTSATRTINTQIGHGRLKWVVQGMGWEAAKDTYPEVRIFLQNLGTAAKRVFGDTVWLDAVLQPIGRHDNVVIPDVRFLIEAEAIQALGGKVIRINRPGHEARGHVSETELSDWGGWDAEFANDTSIMDLQAKVVDWARRQINKQQPKVAA